MDSKTEEVQQQKLVKFKAGTYEIHLVLDSREIHGRVDRSYFQRHLSSNGVNVLTRSLPIGDVIWVAKPVDDSCEDEIVLNYIVERKVVDDLASSFTDGRYKNQKQRMGECGLENKIYIIQRSFKMSGEREVSMKNSTRLAIIKSQLVQNFFVKQTDSIHESVEYLVRLTRKLESVHQGKDLEAVDLCTENFKKSSNNSVFIPNKPLITFKLFSHVNKSASSNCLGRIWLKQLMSIKGVSMEKALTISEQYPTMKHLLDAFDKCENSAQRALLLTKLRRFGAWSINPALATKIVSQFCSETYTD